MKNVLKLFLLICFYSGVVFAQNMDTPPGGDGNPKPVTPAPQTPAPNIPPPPAENSNLSITGAYVQALIPGQNNTAAYMTITNNTADTYVLTGATSNMAEKTELHTVLMQDSVMKMRPVDEITLLPGQQVVLQPGDFHVMLIGVNQELTKDTLVPICLTFKNSATICKDVPVVDKHTTEQHNHM